MAEPSFHSRLDSVEVPEAVKLSAPNLFNAPIGNMGIVSANIYRGSELEKEDDYKFLKKQLGVDIVVDLRYFERDDQELCRKYGLQCVQFPLALVILNDAVFDWNTFRKAFRFVLDQRGAGKKIYIHCKHGSDRTGALASAIMIRERACGIKFDKHVLWSEIDSTLKKYGFHNIYPFLRHKIKDWVFEFEKNPWLCE